MLRETALVFAALVVLARATDVNKCDSEEKLPESDGQVSVSNCDKDTCLLKQGTKALINIKFKPTKKIDTLTNDVHALLAGVPLPFIGVDGTDACENMYNLDGTKVGCPLQPGVEYMYKNGFDVLAFYPRVALTVRYGLRDNSGMVVCFELPSKITK